ncbi:rhodanese-like domain-containing protein [Halalkalibacter urbisdiaboli]|uniref:rhodanese-like domain-containing protein n=1 Tax=Halalkalibacter urbisdiaboli TaxID=1960589 RepID=UPI000B42EC6D|nr:rhodanese-like domain-containing protein [Halalkalibacter urbisdiaboli]
MAFEQDGIVQVEVDELKELLNSDTIIVDVRELEEYDEAHIPGVPLIPMNSIPHHMEKLDKGKSYVFVCRSGARSQNVALYLNEHGFTDVKNYAGGMLNWDGERSSGLEWVVKDTGELYKGKD